MRQYNSGLKNDELQHYKNMILTHFVAVVCLWNMLINEIGEKSKWKTL